MAYDTLADDLLLLFPTWEEGIWEALQKKQYRAAAERFAILVRSMNPDERRSIAWGTTIRGVPAARGAVTESEWEREVRPFLIREFLEIATGRIVADVLNGFDPQDRILIFKTFITAIPGGSPEEKQQWLARQKSTSASYFLATPAQIFDPSAPGTDREISPDLAVKKFLSLTNTLQRIIFTYDTAETIHRAATENLLDAAKTRAVARVAGRVLVGFEAPHHIAKTIGNEAILDEKTSETLAREFRSRIFAPIFSDLEEAYEPPEDFNETAKKIFEGSTVEANVPSFAEFHRNPPSSPLFQIPIARGENTFPAKDTKQAAPAPFVLHDERPFADAAKKESMKGFSLPFGLFKPKSAPFGAVPKATVEAPASVSAFTKTPENKEEKKVVHYSEYRTDSLSETEGEVINLETFGRVRMNTDGTANTANTPAVTPPSPPPITISTDEHDGSGMTPPSNITIKKSEVPLPNPPPSPGNAPALEGNIVDLR
ncbi:MAG: hypothetical protein HYU81_01725 [Candidatus Brennerbacteria bacterium]|nr:hypothetical protein [Candidatus Brennerbacteria bacterium]